MSIDTICWKSYICMWSALPHDLNTLCVLKTIEIVCMETNSHVDFNTKLALSTEIWLAETINHVVDQQKMNLQRLCNQLII